jgi:hypothetical protein
MLDPYGRVMSALRSKGLASGDLQSVAHRFVVANAALFGLDAPGVTLAQDGVGLTEYVQRVRGHVVGRLRIGPSTAGEISASTSLVRIAKDADARLLPEPDLQRRLRESDPTLPERSARLDDARCGRRGVRWAPAPGHRQARTRSPGGSAAAFPRSTRAR